MKIINKILIISLIIFTLVFSGCGNGATEETKELTPDEYVMNLDVYAKYAGINLKTVSEESGSCETCKELEYVFDPSMQEGITGTVTVIISTKDGKVRNHKVIDNTNQMSEEEFEKKVIKDAEMQMYEIVLEYAKSDDMYLTDKGINLKFIQKDAMNDEMDCDICFDFLFVYDAVEINEETGAENYVEKELSYLYIDGEIQ